jgi:hypothetical protein
MYIRKKMIFSQKTINVCPATENEYLKIRMRAD